jgi:hypothetical protein
LTHHCNRELIEASLSHHPSPPHHHHGFSCAASLPPITAGSSARASPELLCSTAAALSRCSSPITSQPIQLGIVQFQFWSPAISVQQAPIHNKSKITTTTIESITTQATQFRPRHSISGNFNLLQSQFINQAALASPDRFSSLGLPNSSRRIHLQVTITTASPSPHHHAAATSSLRSLPLLLTVLSISAALHLTAVIITDTPTRPQPLTDQLLLGLSLN